MISRIKKFIVSNQINEALRKNVDLLFVMLSLFLGIYWQMQLISVAMFGFVTWVILNHWDSRRFAKIALFFLVLVTVALLSQRDKDAEQLAVYVYCFLSLSVISAVIDLRSSSQTRG